MTALKLGSKIHNNQRYETKEGIRTRCQFIINNMKTRHQTSEPNAPNAEVCLNQNSNMHSFREQKNLIDFHQMACPKYLPDLCNVDFHISRTNMVSMSPPSCCHGTTTPHSPAGNTICEIYFLNGEISKDAAGNHKKMVGLWIQGRRLDFTVKWRQPGHSIHAALQQMFICEVWKNRT